MDGTCNMHKREKPKGTGQSRDTGVDGRIILKYNDGMDKNMWLRI
jgi:hypothetical protein